MSDPKTKVTREELHQMIWQQPLVRLAAALGYSYTELGSICADFKIPRPSGGYWYRLEHGGAEEQTPLPPAPSGKPTEIPLGHRRGLDDVHPAHRETKEATGVESDSNTQASIEVSEVSGTQAAAPTPKSKSKDRRTTSEPPPTSSPVPITRDELYRKVWNATLGKLVVELGTELVRACEELNVPRPDHSYWSRLRLKLSVAVPPLPEPTPTTALEFLLRRKGAPGLRPVERTEAPPTKRAEEVPLPKTPTVPNVPNPKVVEFTRKELYEVIWSKPCLKLASELGISDVGLAKTCRRPGIPRPARGYWARIEAGEKLRRTALPDGKPGQRDKVTFHVAENVARREEQALNYIPTAGKGGKLEPGELPGEGVEIHPIAEKHRQALEKAKVGEMGFVSIRNRNVFASELTIGMIPLYARALHPVICDRCSP